MPVPVEVKALENYKLWIRYSDGVEGVVDLSDFAGKGVFSLWDDYRVFENVYIAPSGEIAWSDEVDMCLDAMYLRITGKQPEDIFPKLRELVHEEAWPSSRFDK